MADDGKFEYYISDVKPKDSAENEVWLLGVSQTETMMCTKGTGGPRNCKMPFICAGPSATPDQVVVECNVFGQKLELKIARAKK